MIAILIVFVAIGMLIYIDISLTKTNREKDSDEVVEDTIANIKRTLSYDISSTLHDLHSKTLREVREATTLNGDLLILNQDDISDISERYRKELDAAFSDIVKKMYSETMSGMQGDGKRSYFGTAMSFHGGSHYFLAFQKLTMRKMIRALKKLEDEVMGVMNELKESCWDKNPVPGSIVLSRYKHDMPEKDIEEGKKRIAFKFEKIYMINVGKFLYEVRDKLCR
jgi:hypothetical protein